MRFPPTLSKSHEIRTVFSGKNSKILFWRGLGHIFQPILLVRPILIHKYIDFDKYTE
jgi:hypothetical protein